MIQLLTRAWKHTLTRGVINLAFGVAALTWPEKSVSVFLTLFAGFFLLVGVVTSIGALRGRQTRSGWLIVLIQGLLGVAIGVAVLAWPAITSAILLILVASWAVATGALEILAAILLRRQLEGEWLMIVTGSLSVAFGVILGLNPAQGLVTLAWLFGVFALLRAAGLLLLAWRLRRLRNEVVEGLS